MENNRELVLNQKYYAVFGRSYDEGCKGNNIHLVSSVYSTTKDIDLSSLRDALKIKKINVFLSDSDQFIVVRVLNVPFSGGGVDEGSHYDVVKHSENLIEFRVSLYY